MCALIVHCYNLRNGFVCTGFDEDDPQPDDGQMNSDYGGIVNLSETFEENSREIMTFRYKAKDIEGDIILKIVP